VFGITFRRNGPQDLRGTVFARTLVTVSSLRRIVHAEKGVAAPREQFPGDDPVVDFLTLATIL